MRHRAETPISALRNATVYIIFRSNSGRKIKNRRMKSN